MHDGDPMLFRTTQGGGFVQVSSCKAQENLPNPVLQEKNARYRTNQWGSDSPMDLDKLPRVQTSATGMHQEPCGSENE